VEASKNNIEQNLYLKITSVRQYMI